MTVKQSTVNFQIRFLLSRLFLKQILYLFTVNNYANGCEFTKMEFSWINVEFSYKCEKILKIFYFSKLE